MTEHDTQEQEDTLRSLDILETLLIEADLASIYKLSFLTRGAIDRLHREGQPVRRIAIRTGIPIPIVERHLAKAGVGKNGGSSP